MLKFSSKCMYAIRAMFDLAYHGDGQPSCGRDIAEREEVPQRFLEQILLDLKRAGLVKSKRGPSGGYFLAREPEDVTVLEIAEAIDGPIPVTFCQARDEEARLKCQLTSKCVTASIWRDVADSIREKLGSITLKAMVERGETMGICREGEQAYFYVI